MPPIKSAAESRVFLVDAARLPGVVRVCIAWALLMLGHFVVLTYIDAYFKELGIPANVTSLSLFVLGAGGILGIILIGQISKRSMSVALVVAPAAVDVALNIRLSDAEVAALEGPYTVRQPNGYWAAGRTI